MKTILNRLFNHEELTREETKQILLNITEQKYPDAQIAALLTAFQMRGITVEELIGFREALMQTRLAIDFAPYHPIDIVGTGGDGKNTFNISTCACFVVAGAGYKVAKHGNYGATSVSGASNVIEAHGVKFTNDADRLLPGIAPELNRIGIMMPYTPIHWLLFFEAIGRPEDPDWYKKECDLVLVMTSANAGGEPLVIGNDEAVQKLDGIADLFLTHNRDILIRCDDSVMQQRDQDVQLIRRARGFTPVAVRLPYGGPSVIATGPWLKNTACLTKGDHAFLTQHIGDTDRVSNCRTLARAVEHLSEIFEITPKYIACDLHPDFYSTSLAEELADKYDAELVPVQHHHAHIAAVMAEHGLSEPVLGLALDGVGLGTDNKPWGGELLKVTPEGFERLSSIAPIKMPGADKCAREGWRMAAKIFAENGKTDALEKLAKDVNKPSLRLIAAQANAPETTSLGRLFDAAASMFGICHISSYEGEAPVRLQAASEGRRGQNRADLVEVISGHPNFVRLLLALSEYADKRQAAADFQETLAQVLAKKVITVSEKEQIRKVCLSGGCCLNSLLTQRLRKLLEQQELQVYEGLKVPPNDGGVSLGQAWVVLMRLHSTAKE